MARSLQNRRRLIERVIFVLAATVFAHTWFIKGFPVSCQVDGGSMAPALFGSHVDWTCPNCRFAFACDARDSANAAFVVCPNCAARFTPETAPVAVAGDRVLIDRSAYQFRRPRRWEVVAFERMKEGEGLIVKRVVGLPGEDIAIRDGRVYADDTIVRRNLRQQRSMHILVHDDDYAGPAPRWRPQDFGSNWTRSNGRLVHTESPNDEIGWVVYNHADIFNDGSQQPPLVTDYGYYNRGRMQRNEDIHPTPDVAMSFRLKDIHGRGMIWLQANDGRDEFMVQIDPRDDTFKIVKNRSPLPDGSGRLPPSLRGETIEVSLIDRQFLLAVGSKTVFTASIDSPGEPPCSRQPLAIGVQGLGVGVDHLRVYRAVYYSDPPMAGRKAVTSCQLQSGEYFVLGDNSPISEDSRTWAQDRLVTDKALAGKPFVVIYPACRVSLLGWQIQVPDLTRIRYIR